MKPNLQVVGTIRSRLNHENLWFTPTTPTTPTTGTTPTRCIKRTVNSCIYTSIIETYSALTHTFCETRFLSMDPSITSTPQAKGTAPYAEFNMDHQSVLILVFLPMIFLLKTTVIRVPAQDLREMFRESRLTSKSRLNLFISFLC